LLNVLPKATFEAVPVFGADKLLEDPDLKVVFDIDRQQMTTRGFIPVRRIVFR
jgi:hypothetical protein